MLKRRIFELRIYEATPGKLEALTARFRNPTVQLFAKHGLTVEGFWEEPARANTEPDRLIYLLSFDNLEEASARWAAFRADSEWIEARARTEVNGLLVARVESRYMSPTDFSPIS